MFVENPWMRCAESASFIIRKQILTKPLAGPNHPLMIAAYARLSAREASLTKPLKSAVNNSLNNNPQPQTSARDQSGPQRHSGSLQAIGLSKYYGRRQVVKDVSMQVNSGVVVGLLGSNGSGENSIFSMIVVIVCFYARRIVYK